MSHIDLSQLPSGETYENTYGAYLDIFKVAAESDEPIMYTGVPLCWSPLLHYLGNEVHSMKPAFIQDRWFVTTYLRNCTINAGRTGNLREFVEMVCASRPELTNALWLSDMEWETTNKRHKVRKEFVVTNANSYFCSELRGFGQALDSFTPSMIYDTAVLVPCAADKPYPAPVHKAVMEILKSNEHLIISSGVVGLAPKELWPVMPHYDSGTANEWRAMVETEKYFNRLRQYKKIVCYTDFYSTAISRARIVGVPDTRELIFVNRMPKGSLRMKSDNILSDVVDLLDEKRLLALAKALGR